MRINNNISAMNTYSRLTSAQGAQSKSLEKLSSGLRINRAGDDAAGLAISEKMRGQIKGLNQGVRNAQDGISLIQTAEGALNETHSILNRMRELAVQSANDTNTDDDRIEIQKEINQLAEEITRISSDTEFNTQKLLNGKFDAKFHIGSNKGQNMRLQVEDMSASALGVEGPAAGVKAGDITVAGTALTGTPDIALTTTPMNVTVETLDGTLTIADASIATAGADVTANYAMKNDDGEYVAISADGKNWHIAESAEAKLSDLVFDGDAEAKVSLTSASLKNGSAKLSIDAATNGKVTLETTDAVYEFAADTNLASGTYTVSTSHTIKPAAATSVLLDSNKNIVASSTDETTFKDLDGNTVFTLNAAATNGTELTVAGGGGIDVSSQNAADAAIKTIDDAITAVSAERSKLGAVQNRLDHTINNLTTTSENLSAAESRIRDVDMAKEMMEFTKNNILNQASTAMLAQANQMPQGVLQLLG